MLETDISEKLHLNSVKGLDMRKRIHAVTHRCGIRQPNTFNGLCLLPLNIRLYFWKTVMDIMSCPKKAWCGNECQSQHHLKSGHSNAFRYTPMVKKGLIHHNFVGPCHLHFWSWKSISIESSSNFPHFDSDELTHVQIQSGSKVRPVALFYTVKVLFWG